MLTEVFGFIIILGTVMIVVLRRQLKKAPGHSSGFEGSTDRLRRELEMSADEIIHRMGEHMDRLEKLIQEADQKTARLDAKIEEFKAVTQGAYPAGSGKSSVEDFSSLLQQSMVGAPPEDEDGLHVDPAGMAEPSATDVPPEPEKPVHSKGASAAARVRELLREGYSVEDIAKETNMGRGAIELVRQMGKHQR